MEPEGVLTVDEALDILRDVAPDEVRFLTFDEGSVRIVLRDREIVVRAVTKKDIEHLLANVFR